MIPQWPGTRASRHLNMPHTSVPIPLLFCSLLLVLLTLPGTLLLCDAFVRPQPTFRTRLHVMTEPPQSDVSATSRDDNNDHVNAPRKRWKYDPHPPTRFAVENADYFLQTEDFAAKHDELVLNSNQQPAILNGKATNKNGATLSMALPPSIEAADDETINELLSADHHDQDDQTENQPRRPKKNPVQALWERWRNRPQLVSTKPHWKRLEKHAEHVQTLHLRDLLQNRDRSDTLFATHDGIYFDYARQQVTTETMQFLYDLARTQQVPERVAAMMRGDKINFTEDRAVLHTALRAPREQRGTVFVDGMDVIKEVHDVLDQIKKFTNGVRAGTIRGYTGRRLRNIISVGIGGSYLGPEFLSECLKTEPDGIHAAVGYNLRFLANVDPVDVERTCADLDPEETLIVVVSKTFTTAETMLNARTMRQWLWDFMGKDRDVVHRHMVACASESALAQVQEFGIDTSKYFFKFWDFVGGRYSVCSAAGAVPISLRYGFDVFERFLQGAHSLDEHFATAPMDRNIPLIMGLLGVWNMSFLKYSTRTCLPYAEALLKLPAHIQQLDMESNGKIMTRNNLEVDYPVGEIDFGEAGTNAQHSFYQALHMAAQVVPSEFIGFVESQHDFCLDGESMSSHDELMANFFAQPDALANGKSAEEVRAEGVREDLIPHRVFKGNRPSWSLLLPKLTAYACGQILALYEHRTVVQGFIWDINSFDQWGVELGKKLAIDVKAYMTESRQSGDKNHQVETGNPATTRLLNYYLQNSRCSCDADDDDAIEDEHAAESSTLTKVTRKTHKEHYATAAAESNAQQEQQQRKPPIRHDSGGNEGRLL